VVKAILALLLTLAAWPASAQTVDPSLYAAMRWRMIGP